MSKKVPNRPLPDKLLYIITHNIVCIANGQIPSYSIIYHYLNNNQRPSEFDMISITRICMFTKLLSM